MHVEIEIKVQLKLYAMMKKSIFTLVFLAVMGWASAQSLQFELNGHVFANDEMVFCFDYIEDFGEFVQDMQIRNLSGNDLNVIVEREEVSVAEGSLNYFCWGLCFNPEVSVSRPPVPVAAGDVSVVGALAFHYSPMESTGSSSIRYYAYDPEVEDSRVSIIIVFNSAEDVSERTFADMGCAYPNPASSAVHFNYEVSAGVHASISVYNLLGQEVLKQDLTNIQGQAVLSVADLTEGIYFCNLKVDGRTVKTEKFIVRK